MEARLLLRSCYPFDGLPANGPAAGSAVKHGSGRRLTFVWREIDLPIVDEYWEVKPPLNRHVKVIFENRPEKTA